MSAINTATSTPPGATRDSAAFVSEPISGDELAIGSGFRAESFRARDVGAAMDPLVMVDHYVMMEPTFGEHPHAGISAVSLLFEDSTGLFRNRDSLGNDFDLQPGDLYWLSAGRGAVHDESPRAKARIHGLQVFVNVPQAQRFATPASRLVRSADMPVISTAAYRVKVALGESNGVRGTASPANPMTILDGTIRPGGRFAHHSADNRGTWIQSVEGRLDVVVGDVARRLSPGQAVAVSTEANAMISFGNPSRESVHFVLFEGARIAETYVQEGPFVMGSQAQIAHVKAAHRAGQFGAIAGSR